MKSFRIFLAALFAFAPSVAWSQQTPNHAYGAFTVGGTAVVFPKMLVGLCAYSISNQEASQTIYVGYDSSVTTTTGTPILAGQPWSETLSYQSVPAGTTLWFIASGSGTTNAIKFLVGC